MSTKISAKNLEIENRTVATRITLAMYDRLLEYLAVSGHLSISDYLRDLVRKDIINDMDDKTNNQDEKVQLLLHETTKLANIVLKALPEVAKQLKEETVKMTKAITIEVSKKPPMLIDVKGLPKGWGYEVVYRDAEEVEK